MAGDSVCGEEGPVGSGAWIGAPGRWRPSRAGCSYQVGHNGRHSWEGMGLQPMPEPGRLPNVDLHATMVTEARNRLGIAQYFERRGYAKDLEGVAELWRHVLDVLDRHRPADDMPELCRTCWQFEENEDDSDWLPWPCPEVAALHRILVPWERE